MLTLKCCSKKCLFGVCHILVSLELNFNEIYSVNKLSSSIIYTFSRIIQLKVDCGVECARIRVAVQEKLACHVYVEDPSSPQSLLHHYHSEHVEDPSSL